MDSLREGTRPWFELKLSEDARSSSQAQGAHLSLSQLESPMEALT